MEKYKFICVWLVLMSIFLENSCEEFSQGIEIDLIKHKSPRELMLEVETGEEHLPHLSKYRADAKLPLPNDTVALYKFLDSDYYGIIGIGHPAQTFNVLFDTSWANMYVPSKLCGITVPACWLLNKYDNRRSGTYKRNGTAFSVTEDKSSVYGFLSIDDVNLGHIKVKQQTFGEATHLPLTSVFSKVDGVIGMGLDPLAILGVETVFSNIFQQKLIQKPIFSFYLNRDTTTPHGGSLLLGASDPKHYFPNTSVTVPVTSNYYWQFKTDKMVVDTGKDNQTFCSGGCQCVIDTSTRVIIGPKDDIAALNNFIQATSLWFNRYEIPCDQIEKLPALNFTIGGKVFTMHGRDLAQKMSVRGVQLCLSVFVPTPLGPPNDKLWYLGSAFLQRAYVTFDLAKHTLTFAKAK